jgi:hypothetical protein
VPINEMGAIATALGSIARKEGKTARMRQIGNVLELFTVPDVDTDARREQTPPEKETSQ